MNKKLAIILVNWNQYELTKSCIMSIFNCSYQNFKVIVVDNCSKDIVSAGLRPPALIVIGEIVNFRNKLDWF